jgi:hypothetical protein
MHCSAAARRHRCIEDADRTDLPAFAAQGFFQCHGFSRRRASNGIWLRPPLIKSYQFHAYLKGVMAGPVVQYIS